MPDLPSLPHFLKKHLRITISIKRDKITIWKELPIVPNLIYIAYKSKLEVRSPDVHQ